MDIIPNLKTHKSKFNKFLSESEKLIYENDYKIIEYYGIILCYMIYYDRDNLIKLLAI